MTVDESPGFATPYRWNMALLAGVGINAIAMRTVLPADRNAPLASGQIDGSRGPEEAPVGALPRDRLATDRITVTTPEQTQFNPAKPFRSGCPGRGTGRAVSL